MTEQDIIQGCKRGRAKCQKELVLRYSPVLMTIARRYCRDTPSAEDVLQDAFVRIFKAIDQYQPTGSFQGWMRRIVINVALQKKARAGYQKEPSGLSGVSHPEVAPVVLKQLEAETAIQLIQQLPDGFRMVFNLHVFEGYTHGEIGAMLGISAATSRSQLARARQKLQAMIKQLEKQNYVKRAG